VIPDFAAAPQLDEQAGSQKAEWSKEAKAALDRLIEGNERFVAGKSVHKNTSADWRAQIAKGQHPFATILGCSDSRVVPEIIFDQGLGSLFDVRVAGNVVNMDVDGSLEYAGWHLGTRLFMVLGHENCGAVSAALQAHGKEKEPPGLRQLIEHLRPVFKDIDPKLPYEKRFAAAVEANVRWAIKQLTDVPELKKAIDNGKVILVGAVYELETGKVRMLK
jgi:carbonic anhydrase